MTEQMITDITLREMQRSNGVGRLGAIGASGSTMLKTLYQQGNAKLRIPTDHQCATLEAVMINTSGGMTGGDELNWTFEANRGADLSLTTQACERIYKSTGDYARSSVQLKAGDDSSLSWLPQETILFDQAKMRRKIDLDLAQNARALVLEPIVFGRMAMGENVTKATIHDRWRIRQNGQLVHAEDFRMSGEIDEQLNHGAVFAGNRAIATALLIGPDAEALLDDARSIAGDSGAASFWNGKLLVRLVAADSYSLRKSLVPLIRCLSGNATLPKCWMQ